MLLNDLNSRIPVVISPNGDQAILTGVGRKKPVLEYLPENFEIKSNSLVYTSGKDGVLYAGISIGEISDQIENRIEVKLFSDPDQVFLVTAILEKITDAEAM